MQHTVSLGKHHEVPVYPQPHARLTNHFNRWVVELGPALKEITVENGADEFLASIGSSAYDLFEILIPAYTKRCPYYEFCGYPSKEALEDSNYERTDADYDSAPTFPEILDAFQIAIKVNRFDVLKILGSFIDPKVIRGLINERLARLVEDPPDSTTMETTSESTDLLGLNLSAETDPTLST